MDSPPAMGASRSTGRIFHAKAYDNKPNHADFPKITDIPQAGNQQVLFKVFAYLVYSDPITIDVMPDPSIRHNVSFTVLTFLCLTVLWY